MTPAPTVRIADDPTAIDLGQWQQLLARQHRPTPFLRLEYLRALHESGSAVDASGWSPRFLLIERDGALVAACPIYLKAHSYGEYVFDWAWADAYQRNGLAYYPKLLGAVPFTPVPGTRLLAENDDDRRTLLRAMTQIAERSGLSSAHLLFLDDVDAVAATREGWLPRTTVQFHWHNRSPEPYADFAEFLAGLHREKRKKIQQERRRVADAGLTFDVLEGTAIGADDWNFFYACYASTYRAHHSTPYLKRAFFAQVAATMPEHWLLFVARRGDERIAASLVVIDRAQRTAYGRYWGAASHVPCLHFDACYYQPLAWCIAQGFQCFEGGAQGEHKMARGLLPVQTHSAHWLAHPQFFEAIADHLRREGASMDEYVNELNERGPYKAPPDGQTDNALQENAGPPQCLDTHGGRAGRSLPLGAL